MTGTLFTKTKIFLISSLIIVFSTYSFATESFVELFLDNECIDTSSGVSMTVNKPTKYVGNPLLSLGDLDDWDQQYAFTHAMFLRISGSYVGWYMAKDDVNVIHTAKLLSNDMLTITKPNLGLITYNGNTNNNLLIENRNCLSVRYFPERSSDQRYIAAMYQTGISGGVVSLHKSADGNTWTLLKTIMNGIDYPEGTLEIKDFIQKDDGKWIIYCVTGHNTRRRKIVALTSDTTDPAGAWSYASGYPNGVILSPTSYTDQKYKIATIKIGGIYLHQVAIFQSENIVRCGKESGVFPQVDLYISRNGLALTLADSAWFTYGSSGQFDDSLLYPQWNFLRFSNDWRIYYTGSGENHDNCVWKTAYPAFLSIGYRRIGQVASTGTIITTERTTGGSLLVNTNATGGSLKVELLDPSVDSVLTGYSINDCDSITTDVYEHLVRWNGSKLLPSENFRIKFYLTDAILYSYSMSDDWASLAMGSGPGLKLNGTSFKVEQ